MLVLSDALGVPSPSEGLRAGGTGRFPGRCSGVVQPCSALPVSPGCGNPAAVQSPPGTSSRCTQGPAAAVGAGACFGLPSGVQGHPKEPSLLWLVPQPDPTGDTRQGPAGGEGEAGAGSPCPQAAITALTSFLSGFSMPLIHPGQMAASQRSRGWQGDGGSALPGGHRPRSPCSAPAHGPGEAAAPVGATWPRPQRGPRRCGGAGAHRPGRG